MGSAWRFANPRASRATSSARLPNEVAPGHWIGSGQRQALFAGSYGVPARNRAGETFILTAAHVLGGLQSSPSAPGSVAVDFGDAGAPVLPARTVGTIAERIPGRRTGAATVAEIDCGTVRLKHSIPALNCIAGRRVAGVRRFEFDDEVEESIEVFFEGAASGTCAGLLQTARVELAVKIAKLGTSTPRVIYTSVCDVKPLDEESLGVDGDSGSVLVDEEGRLVAVLVAADDAVDGESAGVVAVPIWLAFDRLGLEPCDEEVVLIPYESAFGVLAE